MATEADDSIKNWIDDLTQGDLSGALPVRVTPGEPTGDRGPAADEAFEDDPDGEIADEPRTVANRPGSIRSLRAGAGEL